MNLEVVIFAICCFILAAIFIAREIHFNKLEAAHAKDMEHHKEYERELYKRWVVAEDKNWEYICENRKLKEENAVLKEENDRLEQDCKRIAGYVEKEIMGESENED